MSSHLLDSTVIKDENENDKKNVLSVKFIVNKPNNEIIFNQ